MIMVFACGQRRQYPITQTKVGAGFYEEALQSINDQIITSPSNLKLRYNRLFINSHLNWQEDASDDIQKIIKEEGLSRNIYSYGVEFYRKYGHHQSLLNLIHQWEQLTGQIDYRNKIVALDGLGNQMEAKSLLWDYLDEGKADDEVLTFASDLFQIWNDTLIAIYSMSMLYNQNQDHPYLIDHYVPLLVSTGKYEKALEVVGVANLDSMKLSQRIDVAKIYFGLGEERKAHHLLESQKDKEIFELRSEWYQQSKKLDSAIMMVDRILEIDTTDFALIRKAQLTWDKGLLYGALALYEEVLKRDSLNSIAQESAAILNRKIAYLRRLREKETTIPFLELSTKKETENE